MLVARWRRAHPPRMAARPSRFVDVVSLLSMLLSLIAASRTRALCVNLSKCVTTPTTPILYLTSPKKTCTSRRGFCNRLHDSLEISPQGHDVESGRINCLSNAPHSDE